MRATRDHAEGDRRHAREVRIIIHPRRELPGKLHVPLDQLANAARAEAAQHHPELQCAEPAPQLDARVHQIPGLGLRKCACSEQ